MPTDNTTRLLLAGILICLIVLVVQGFGSERRPSPGRYLMMATRAGTPLLLRMDTATGRAWKQELRGGRGRWVEFTEPSEESGETSGEDAEESARTAPEPSAPRVAREPDRERPLPPAASTPRPAAPTAAAMARPAAPAPPGRAPAAPVAPSREDMDRFVQALRNPQIPPDIRIWAVKQLAQTDDPRSTEALLEALADEEPRVVAAAVSALGARDHEGVDAALEAVRDNPDPDVQTALAELGR